MILEKIAASTRKRVEVRKKEVPFEKIKAQAEAMEKNTGYPFYRALAQEDMSFICEVKKASPSKGIIAEKFPYLEIAREYEEAGASVSAVIPRALVIFRYSFRFSSPNRVQISSTAEAPRVLAS